MSKLMFKGFNKNKRKTQKNITKTLALTVFFDCKNHNKFKEQS